MTGSGDWIFCGYHCFTHWYFLAVSDFNNALPPSDNADCLMAGAFYYATDSK